MIAVVRYQAGLLLRSHRWVGPLVVYGVFIWFASGAGPGGQPLGASLSWSAGALVPIVAWLTRSMLTAEPSEARACAAAASGPRRAQLAALAAAVAGGVVLGLGGVASDLVTAQAPPGGGPGYARILAAGLATMVICVGVGSAVGALCNPPVVRAVAAGILATTGAVIAALVTSISPANAAIRDSGAHPPAASCAGLPLIAALVLLAASWAISAILAARRGT